jgi:hypothetical protein
MSIPTSGGRMADGGFTVCAGHRCYARRVVQADQFRAITRATAVYAHRTCLLGSERERRRTERVR